MADVRLVDLEFVKRYSLAIRQEYADADEVLEILDRTRQAVERAAGVGRPRSTDGRPRRREPLRAAGREAGSPGRAAAGESRRGGRSGSAGKTTRRGGSGR